MGFSVADSIRILIEPGSLTEVRALYKSKVNPDDRYCRNQYVSHEDADSISQYIHAEDAKDNCVGIYLVSSPVNLELKDLNDPKYRKPFDTKVKSSSSKDCIRRRWLFIDCDSNRPSDVSATDGERSRAFALADDVIETLKVFGFQEPVKADSGNGCHLLYPVDFPSGKSSDLLIKEFLSELSSRCTSTGAKVDTVTYDSQRMIRLYGTKARKGDSTPERPWRTTGIISDGDHSDAARKANTESIQKILEVWRDQNSLAEQLSAKASITDQAKAYIATIEGASSGAGGHNATFRVASILVEGFALYKEEALPLLAEWNASCNPPWSQHELEHKIDDAIEKINPAKLGEKVKKPDFPIEKTIQKDDGSKRKDATVADLIRLGQSMQWIWPGWIQRGVLVGIAAQPGAGKTRLCADLARRIYNHLPWPDGSPPTLDRASPVLWLACDNQWGEIAQFPEQFGIPPEAIYLNSWDDEPTEGTMLDNEKQFKILEDRILRIQPALVFVDTVMNSTQHNTMRPEDGVKYFKPLAEVAQRTNTTIIMVTHLSVGGEALGRRIVGQCRQMINLDRIPDDPPTSPTRRMFVSKSNSVIPNELEVTMGNNGNNYRDPNSQQNGNQNGNNNRNVMWFVGSYLSTGRKLKEIFLSDAQRAGYSIDEINSAVERLADEIEIDGKTFLRTK